MNYLELSDSAFNKAIDALNADAYRALVESDIDVRDRINQNPAWIERRDQKELEALVTRDLQNKKERLNAELRAGRGLSQATWIWLDERNIPTASLSVMPVLKDIKPAYLRLDEKVGPFTEQERAVLLTIAQQCCEIGRVLDLRTDAAWSCAYHIAITSGKIGLTRTQPTIEQEPTMAERISKIAAPPTAADRKREHMTEIVFEHKGKKYTQQMIDACGSDEFRELVTRGGYKKDGPILRSTNDLVRRP